MLGIRKAFPQLKKGLNNNSTNMANNAINVDHGTFMNVLIGGGFLKKQVNSPGE